jgi:hypothetical protein
MFCETFNRDKLINTSVLLTTSTVVGAPLRVGSKWQNRPTATNTLAYRISKFYSTGSILFSQRFENSFEADSSKEFLNFRRKKNWN